MVKPLFNLFLGRLWLAADDTTRTGNCHVPCRWRSFLIRHTGRKAIHSQNHGRGRAPNAWSSTCIYHAGGRSSTSQSRPLILTVLHVPIPVANNFLPLKEVCWLTCDGGYLLRIQSAKLMHVSNLPRRGCGKGSADRTCSHACRGYFTTKSLQLSPDMTPFKASLIESLFSSS